MPQTLVQEGFQLKLMRGILGDRLLWLWGVAGGSFVLKIGVQSLVLVPQLAQIGYTLRNFVIGFLHLLLLGMISHFLLAYGNKEKVFSLSSPAATWGLRFLFVGFLASESLLILQGILLWRALGFLPGYYEMLAGVSALMPLGIGFILLSPRNDQIA